MDRTYVELEATLRTRIFHCEVYLYYNTFPTETRPSWELEHQLTQELTALPPKTSWATRTCSYPHETAFATCSNCCNPNASPHPNPLTIIITYTPVFTNTRSYDEEAFNAAVAASPMENAEGCISIETAKGTCVCVSLSLSSPLPVCVYITLSNHPCTYTYTYTTYCRSVSQEPQALRTHLHQASR